MEEYRFKNKSHSHELDTGEGFKKLRGVTTVINKVVSKGDALINWSANEAVNHIEKIVDSEPSEFFRIEKKVLKEIFKEARVAHRKKKESAGGSGSAVHLAIEMYAKNKEMYSGDDEIVKKSFANFLEWMESKGAEIVESEKHVYSKDLCLGGIIDLVIKINDKKFILDIKSGKAIYSSNVFLQIAAYDILLGEKLDGYICLNLCKDGTYMFERVDEMESWREAFMACLKLYDKLT